ATATLLIESKEAKVVSIEEMYGLDTRNAGYYETQFEILKSRELSEKVIKTLNLASHPEFDPAQQKSRFNFNWRSWLPVSSGEKTMLSDDVKWQSLVDVFLSRLTISPVRKTQLVNINFEAYDAELAATVANALANAYIESHLEARLEMTEVATVWLTRQMDSLKTKVNKAERRLQDFREREDLINLEGVRTLSTKEMQEIISNLVGVRERRSQAENLYNQVSAIKGDENKSFESIPDILNHKLMQGLKASEATAERKIAEFAKRYGPKHPNMITAETELNAVRDNIKKQILSIVAGIENEYNIAVKNENSLSRAMEKTKKDIQLINRKEFQLRELEREVDTNRKLYETFFTRFQEANATSDLQTVNARIMDKAVTPRSAAKPKKKLTLVLTFVVSLMLGVFLAFLLEFLDNTFKNAADVIDKLDKPMLGVLPLVRLKNQEKLNPLNIFSTNNHLGMAESIRSVRTGLLLSGLDNPHKVTLVTSSVPGEGKTTTAVSLAVALGQLGRVLLIDGDMRLPSVSGVFGIPPKSPGLSNLVAGTDKLEDCIHTFTDSGIDVLPCGTIPPNPLELLSSEHFTNMIDQLCERYDRIVIDSAPVSAASDSLVISTVTNSVVYVVKAGSTSVQIAKVSMQRLVDVKAPVVGVILNHMDFSKIEDYGQHDYYAGGYYGGYGSDKS
ncbi:MAG: polysaccharide biosynthesis tyrosine autokinase, partial [Gammaproteobacteria bacterium]|nr:polysaccharide biosynthesis tyrosine autokinase [Gammaproteobacteria bacterium]